MRTPEKKAFLSVLPDNNDGNQQWAQEQKSRPRETHQSPDAILHNLNIVNVFLNDVCTTPLAYPTAHQLEQMYGVLKSICAISDAVRKTYTSATPNVPIETPINAQILSDNFQDLGGARMRNPEDLHREYGRADDDNPMDVETMIVYQKSICNQLAQICAEPIRPGASADQIQELGAQISQVCKTSTAVRKKLEKIANANATEKVAATLAANALLPCSTPQAGKIEFNNVDFDRLMHVPHDYSLKTLRSISPAQLQVLAERFVNFADDDPTVGALMMLLNRCNNPDQFAVILSALGIDNANAVLYQLLNDPAFGELREYLEFPPVAQSQ